jgi:hypothetical protein
MSAAAASHLLGVETAHTAAARGAATSARAEQPPTRPGQRRLSLLDSDTIGHVTVEGMNFYRLKDGRVSDIWTQFDGVGMMQQLGAIPA